MIDNRQKSKRNYFAAQNSYKGFISYFDTIFNSTKYDKIYVLKGGPGTGKSSFMKGVSRYFEERVHSIEEIHCSSDPDSLDGVILEHKGKRVALIDGTAPHERDAVIPGAIDEIINLGIGWSKGWLEGRRADILRIANEKKKAYKAAYKYLSIAGDAHEFIKTMHQEHFDIYGANNKAESILSKISGYENGGQETRLIDSFGRHGHYALGTLSSVDAELIGISGNDLCCSLFLSHLKKIIEKYRVKLIHFPCVLDPLLTDAIYLSDQNIAILKKTDGEFCADELFSVSKTEYERIKTAINIRDTATTEAQRWFGVASQMHFELENIYGEAMNYSVVDALLTKTIEEINNILEKNT